MPPQRSRWHVETRGGSAVVTVRGALDATGGTGLYRTLTQCLAREPIAVLVELSGLTVAEPGAVKVFAAVLQQAEAWPGTPLLLCGPDPVTARLITAEAGPSVPMFDTVADALSTLSGCDELVGASLLPVPGAARRARQVVTTACLRRGLPHLTASATLVAGELVGDSCREPAAKSSGRASRHPPGDPRRRTDRDRPCH